MASIILKAGNVALLKDAPIAHLTADAASGVTTINVENVNGFADNDFLLLGELNSPTAEIIEINDAGLDTSIDLQSATVYDHFLDEPVYKLNYNQVEFSRATTLAGSKSVLATSAITPDRQETIYVDTANSTGFYFWRYKNATTSDFSGYSTGQDYTGNSADTADQIIQRARALANVPDTSPYATEEQLLADINTAQETILFSRDQKTGVNINWSFELTEDKTSIATTQNEHTYALSGLSTALKYTQNKDAIFNVRFGAKVLKYIDPNEMDITYENIVRTDVATEASANDTTLVVDDTNEFASAGTLTVGSDTVTYTAKDDSTATFSGIPASGSGSITATHAVDAAVWQGINAGQPEKYTIFEGNIILDRPPNATHAGKALKFKYLKKVSRLTDIADTVTIPFFYILEYYCVARIEYRKGNSADGDRMMNLFREGINNNQRRYKLAPMDEVQYYNFDNARSAFSRDDLNVVNE